MSSCLACGSNFEFGDRYCGGCGASSGAGTLFAILPAALTGAVVALVGVAVGQTVPVPQGTEIHEKLLRFVLATTIPYFPWAMAFIGGWSAAVALPNRRAGVGLAVGALVGVLYAVARFVVGQLGGPVPGEALFTAAALAPFGGLLAGLAARSLGDTTKLGPLLTRIPGGPCLRTAIAAWLVALAALVLYFLVLVGLVILAFVYFIRIIVALLSGGGDHKQGHPVAEEASVEDYGPSCNNCGSKEHTARDCPHGMFGSGCNNCGSKEHTARDCPHGMFGSGCNRCGSKNHATDKCPHGMFESGCNNCGSKEHTARDCPHGMFGSGCNNCGSKNHATDKCPHL